MLGPYIRSAGSNSSNPAFGGWIMFLSWQKWWQDNDKDSQKKTQKSTKLRGFELVFHGYLDPSIEIKPLLSNKTWPTRVSGQFCQCPKLLLQRSTQLLSQEPQISRSHTPSISWNAPRQESTSWKAVQDFHQWLVHLSWVANYHRLLLFSNFFWALYCQRFNPVALGMYQSTMFQIVR